MNSKWPQVPLGELLRKCQTWIDLSPEEAYKEVTVRLWGRGVVLRREATGAEIGASRRLRVEQGQLIFSRIDARNGAFGIVPPELDGAVVSNDFPVFDVDSSRLLPEFLGWLSRTAGFVETCKAASEGTTNRVRLKEDRFLRVPIALPPLGEQRRIVEKIERLAAKVEEAQAVRRELAGHADQLVRAEELKIWPDGALRGAPSLATVTTFLARGRQSEQGSSDHFLIKTQHVQLDRYLPTILRLSERAAGKVNPDAVAQEGDVLIACSAAGCLGRVAFFRGDGKVASTDTHVAIARADRGVVDPEYLYAYLRGAQGQHQLRSRERGDWRREKIGFRLTELNLDDLRAVPVPVPSRIEQRRIVTKLTALRSSVASIAARQAEVDELLAAFVSSVLSRAIGAESE